jgi:hypothetical protein
MTQSRRQLLSLAVAAVAGSEVAAAAEPLESPNRQYVSRYELSLAVRGGLHAKLGTTSGRVFETDLAFPDASDQLLRMVELALAGKGRLAVELDNDGRTIRNFRLEAP